MTATRPPVCQWCRQPVTGQPAYWDGRPQCRDAIRCERRRSRQDGAQPQETDTEATAPRCTHRPNYCWGCPGGCASCQCHAADRVNDDEAETP